MNPEYVMYVGGILVGILGYLLAKKDEAQEQKIADLEQIHGKQITTLWEKHDIDAKELENLKLLVASKHYERGELDSKFDKLETSFKEGMIALGIKLDKLTEVIIHKNVSGQ